MSAPLPLRRMLAVLAVVGLAAPGLPSSWPGQAVASETFTGLIPGIGAGGHDVVAYFTAGRPVAGSASIIHSWNGAVWRFANAANRDAFAAAPERYAPAYGGHCAWAAAQGYKAKGDPHHWKIVGGRLFLNYNVDVQKMWDADIPRFIAAADSKWPDVQRK